MFRSGKSSKTPGPAVAGGEVAVHKVEKIDYVVNLVHIKPPAVHGGAGNAPWKAQQPWTAASKKPERSGDDIDINSKAGRFIENTKNRWRLGLKSFRATGGR